MVPLYEGLVFRSSLLITGFLLAAPQKLPDIEQSAQLIGSTLAFISGDHVSVPGRGEKNFLKCFLVAIT